MGDDAQFAATRGARVGSPALVQNPAGEPAFWLVPLLVKDQACGYAQVDLKGTVDRIGIFGAGPQDRASWIDAAFFKRPPSESLVAIEADHPEATVSEPVLSYDTTPVRWAWRLEITSADRIEAVAFITPGGWYERPGEVERPELEGSD